MEPKLLQFAGCFKRTLPHNQNDRVPEECCLTLSITPTTPQQLMLATEGGLAFVSTSKHHPKPPRGASDFAGAKKAVFCCGCFSCTVTLGWHNRVPQECCHTLPITQTSPQQLWVTEGRGNLLPHLKSTIQSPQGELRFGWSKKTCILLGASDAQ